jgi:hypothetical protein
MNNNPLAETIEELQEEAGLCWTSPGHPMIAWAEEWERTLGNKNHGLGDLTRICPRRTDGEPCPACGRRF